MPLLAGPSPGRAATIVFNMLRHGHLADAVSYLSDPPSREQYPYTAAMEAIGRSRNDEESQRSILRGAIRARLGESGPSAHGFDMLFALEWSLLPAEEAKIGRPKHRPAYCGRAGRTDSKQVLEGRERRAVFFNTRVQLVSDFRRGAAAGRRARGFAALRVSATGGRRRGVPSGIPGGIRSKPGKKSPRTNRRAVRTTRLHCRRPFPICFPSPRL
jgi:hypothetical protein